MSKMTFLIKSLQIFLKCQFIVSEVTKHFQVMFRHHMEPFDTISDYYLLEKLKLFLKTLRFCPSLNPTKSRTLKNTTVPEVSNAAEISNAAEMSRLYRLLFKFPTKHQISTLKCFTLTAGLDSKKPKMRPTSLKLPASCSTKPSK